MIERMTMNDTPKKELPRIGNRIRAEREARQLEATKVALELGMNYRGLLKIESHKQPVTLDQLGALAELFKCSLFSLIQDPDLKTEEITQFVEVSKEEESIINYYRRLDPGMQKFIEDVLQHAATFGAMHSICQYVAGLDPVKQQAVLATAKGLTLSASEDQIDGEKDV